MRSFLHVDEETRELRLVMVDFDRGAAVHERTEFRVTDPDGTVLRGVERWAHLDGAAVAAEHGPSGVRFYVPARTSVDRELRLTTEERATGATERTACMQAVKGRGRRRPPTCPHCEAEGRA